MNKLHEVLEREETQTLEQFEKSFRKVFGIPAEVEDYDGSIFFNSHGEKFSIDHEGTLLWHINGGWKTVQNLQQAKKLWRS